MLIPSYVNNKITDDSGNLTPEWQQFFTQLSTVLQMNLGDEGYVLPKQSSANINNLTADQSIGAMIYDSTTNEFKVNLNGTWRVVQVV